jgi:hypothetical protein
MGLEQSMGLEQRLEQLGMEQLGMEQWLGWRLVSALLRLQ